MEPWDVKEHYLSSMEAPGLGLELLDKLIYCLKGASLAIERGNIEETHNQLILAQTILVEFQKSIRQEDAGSQLAKQFLELLEDHLFVANITKSKQKTDQALRWVQRLRTDYAYHLGKKN